MVGYYFASRCLDKNLENITGLFFGQLVFEVIYVIQIFFNGVLGSRKFT
jgi:hypothetical protein